MFTLSRGAWWLVTTFLRLVSIVADADDAAVALGCEKSEVRCEKEKCSRRRVEGMDDRYKRVGGRRIGVIRRPPR